MSKLFFLNDVFLMIWKKNTPFYKKIKINYYYYYYLKIKHLGYIYLNYVCKK